MMTLLLILVLCALLLALLQRKSEPWPHPTDDKEPAGAKGEESE